MLASTSLRWLLERACAARTFSGPWRSGRGAPPAGSPLAPCRRGLPVPSGRRYAVLDLRLLEGIDESPMPGVAAEPSVRGLARQKVAVLGRFHDLEIDGLRVSFSFDAKGAASSELRLVLKSGDKPISETWLYRWTKD